MLTDCPLCTPENSWSLMQWNSKKSDDFEDVLFATQQRDTATKHEVYFIYSNT